MGMRLLKEVAAAEAKQSLERQGDYRSI